MTHDVGGHEGPYTGAEYPVGTRVRLLPPGAWGGGAAGPCDMIRVEAHYQTGNGTLWKSVVLWGGGLVARVGRVGTVDGLACGVFPTVRFDGDPPVGPGSGATDLGLGWAVHPVWLARVVEACVCPSRELFAWGCTCGQMARERAGG